MQCLKQNLFWNRWAHSGLHAIRIDRDNRVLIAQRPQGKSLAGLWEFPGGKIEAGETRELALCREVREELGVDVTEFRFLTSVEHAYTQFRVTLHAFACRLSEPPRLSRDTHRWVTLRGMRRYPFPSGSVRLIRFLEKIKGEWSI